MSPSVKGTFFPEFPNRMKPFSTSISNKEKKLHLPIAFRWGSKEKKYRNLNISKSAPNNKTQNVPFGLSR